MRFWESSALVALVVEQPATARMRTLLEDDADLAVWVLTDVEVRSAIERLAREGALSREGVEACLHKADLFWEQLRVIDLIGSVKQRAKRLLARHPLRAADALQLGAALLASDDGPEGLELVTLDSRLAEAARREGFRVLP